MANYLVLANCDLKEVSFIENRLNSISFISNKLKKVSLDKNEMQSAEIINTSLNNIDLSNCVIDNMKIDLNDLKGVTLNHMQGLSVLDLLNIKIKD